MTDNARRTGTAIEAHYRFLMWLVPTIEKFPRSQKFLLGDRIQTTALDVLEFLVPTRVTERTISPAIGHGIDQEGLRHGGEFLAKQFARRP